jgi:hypothetical protein
MSSRITLMAFLLMLVAIDAAQCSVRAGQPEDTIKALYANYGIGVQGPDSSKQGLDSTNMAPLFIKDVLNLYKRAIDSGGMDYDFFVQGQDFDLAKPIEINSVTVSGSTASISATLFQEKPFTRVTHFRFSLVKQGGTWRVVDAFCRGSSVTSEWAAIIKECKQIKCK